MNRIYQTILQEFKGKTEPTHVPEEVFARIAQQVLKIQNLTQTRLYDKLKVCINDPQETNELVTDPVEMFSIKYFKLLVDLYQFLPSKKN